MNIERARKKDFQELMDVMHRAFQADRPGFERFEELLPDLYQPSSDAMQNIFVIRSGGRIASAAGLFPLMLAIGPVRLRVAGIGGVCTAPEHRGKGGMSALMQHILREAREAGYSLAWLSGQRRRYARFGFERAGAATVVRLAAAARESRVLPWHVAQAQPNAETARTLIKLRNALRVRGLCDDHAYLLKLSRKHVETWIATLGVAQSYLVVNRKTGWFLEWGGDPEGVRALLLHLLAPSQTWFARLSPCRDEYTDVFLQWAEQFDGSQDCLSVLNVAVLLKEYRPWLAPIWPEGKVLQLSVETASSTYSVVVAGGRVVRKPLPGAVSIRLSSTMLPRFLFGPMPPDLLAALPPEGWWVRQALPLPFAMPGLWRV